MTWAQTTERAITPLAERKGWKEPIGAHLKNIKRLLKSFPTLETRKYLFALSEIQGNATQALPHLFAKLAELYAIVPTADKNTPPANMSYPTLKPVRRPLKKRVSEGGAKDSNVSSQTHLGTLGTYNLELPPFSYNGRRLNFSEAYKVLIPLLLNSNDEHVLVLRWQNGVLYEPPDDHPTPEQSQAFVKLKSALKKTIPQPETILFFVFDGDYKTDKYSEFGENPQALFSDSTGRQWWTEVHVEKDPDGPIRSIAFTQEFAADLSTSLFADILNERISYVNQLAADNPVAQVWPLSRNEQIQKVEAELQQAADAWEMNSAKTSSEDTALPVVLYNNEFYHLLEDEIASSEHRLTLQRLTDDQNKTPIRVTLPSEEYSRMLLKRIDLQKAKELALHLFQGPIYQNSTLSHWKRKTPVLPLIVRCIQYGLIEDPRVKRFLFLLLKMDTQEMANEFNDLFPENSSDRESLNQYPTTSPFQWQFYKSHRQEIQDFSEKWMNEGSTPEEALRLVHNLDKFEDPGRRKNPSSLDSIAGDWPFLIPHYDRVTDRTALFLSQWLGWARARSVGRIVGYVLTPTVEESSLLWLIAEGMHKYGQVPWGSLESATLIMGIGLVLWQLPHYYLEIAVFLKNLSTEKLLWPIHYLGWDSISQIPRHLKRAPRYIKQKLAYPSPLLSLSMNLLLINSLRFMILGVIEPSPYAHVFAAATFFLPLAVVNLVHRFLPAVNAYDWREEAQEGSRQWKRLEAVLKNPQYNARAIEDTDLVYLHEDLNVFNRVIIDIQQGNKASLIRDFERLITDFLPLWIKTHQDLLSQLPDELRDKNYSEKTMNAIPWLLIPQAVRDAFEANFVGSQILSNYSAAILSIFDGLPTYVALTVQRNEWLAQERIARAS